MILDIFDSELVQDSLQVVDDVLTIVVRDEVVSDSQFFEVFRHCVLVDVLVIGIDHFSVSIYLFEKALLLHLLEEFDKISKLR